VLFLQTDLVNLLQGKLQSVTVVGDDAQSTYRFRGAQPGVFKAYEVCICIGNWYVQNANILQQVGNATLVVANV
jgi:superfamily I DNA/RNA helicase